MNSSDAPRPDRRGDLPPSPDKLADTGLTGDFVRDLLLKTLYVQGTRTGLIIVPRDDESCWRFSGPARQGPPIVLLKHAFLI